jgi:hypothetical protein
MKASYRAQVLAHRRARAQVGGDAAGAVALAAQIADQEALRTGLLREQRALRPSRPLAAVDVLSHTLAFLKEVDLFGLFAKRVADDEPLRLLLRDRGVRRTGDTLQVDARVLVQGLNDGALRPGMRDFALTRLCQHAQDLLVTAHKNRLQFRVRELLDLLSARVAVPR